MTRYHTDFRNAIDAYIKRRGMSRSRFGRKMMGDPTFVFRMEKGRNSRLDTVDKLLELMGEKPFGPRFRDEVRAFLTVTGTKRSEFGRCVNKNRSFATWVLNGGCPRLTTMDKAHAYMADHTTPAQREAIRAAVEDGVPAAFVPITAEEEEMEMEMDDQAYMSTKEAAKFLKLSHRTLQSYRSSGKGPRFGRFGKAIRYRRSRLAEWAAEREARSIAEADEKDRKERPEISPPDSDGAGRRDA